MATAAKFNVPAERIEQWRAVMMGRTGQPFTNRWLFAQDYRGKARSYPAKDGASRFAPIRAPAGVIWWPASKVDLRDQLGKIVTPTLILAGDDDQVTPPSDAEFLKAGIKGARLEVIADAAHNLTTEQPATVNAAVESSSPA